MSEHLTQQGDQKSSFIVTTDIGRRSRDVLRRRERRREDGLAEQGREDGLAERGGMREHRWRRGVASTPSPRRWRRGAAPGRRAMSRWGAALGGIGAA